MTAAAWKNGSRLGTAHFKFHRKSSLPVWKMANVHRLPQLNIRWNFNFMDLTQLSNEVTMALAPFLPTLLAVGGKVVEGIEVKIGEDVWNKVKTLWSKLHPKIDANPFAKHAVEAVAAAPKDHDLQTAMRVELKKLLAEDADLTREVTKVWVENKNIITNAIASGHQSAAFAAEVTDSLVNTGDKPVFNITHNHPVCTSENPAPVLNISALYQLPTLPAKFTGRVKALEDLEKELAADHAVGAAISGVPTNLMGTPGVGKTALATVLAHRLKDRYPDAQLYQNLRGAGADIHSQYSGPALKPVTPADTMQSIIHAFHPGTKLPENEADLSAIYRSVLTKAGRVLLFLDNAADGNQVRPLLPPPNCQLLVTSRQLLNLDELAEHHLDCLSPEESQELLLNLAPKLKGHETEAAKLCGYLPLALKTVAGMVKSQSLVKPGEIIKRLRDKLDKFEAVDAAFQVSYEILAKESKKRWMLLSVFFASFDLPAAAAVWGEGQAGSPQRAFMQLLVNASLVEHDAANSRFRLHDLVRQFCDGKLTEAERTGLHLAHARHYTAVGRVAKKLFLTKGKHVDGLALFDRERVQIEAAYSWLEARGSRREEAPDKSGSRQEMSLLTSAATDTARQMIALVDAVTYTSDLRFHPRRRIAWLESQLRAARIVKHREAEGVALGNLGIAYKDLGDARKAIEFYELALVIVREIGKRRAEGANLGNLGNAYAALGDARKAIEFYEQCLMLHREIGDRREEGADWGNLGNVYKNLGDARKAIKFYEQHLVIAREIGDRQGEGNALGNLGNAYKDLGDARKAIEFYELALVIAREIGDRHGEGNALGNLGLAYADLGDARKAIEFYEHALVIAREIGDVRGEATNLWNSAVAHDKLGIRAEAITRAEAALKICEAIEDPNVAKVRAKLAEWRGSKP
jgi:tetratricopeptide (TPR) repeat protein